MGLWLRLPEWLRLSQTGAKCFNFDQCGCCCCRSSAAASCGESWPPIWWPKNSIRSQVTKACGERRRRRQRQRRQRQSSTTIVVLTTGEWANGLHRLSVVGGVRCFGGFVLCAYQTSGAGHTRERSESVYPALRRIRWRGKKQKKKWREKNGSEQLLQPFSVALTAEHGVWSMGGGRRDWGVCTLSLGWRLHS